MTQEKNKCQIVKILSENKATDSVEIKFMDSNLEMMIPKDILQSKLDNGFYKLAKA